jgi:hypothetical protein
MRAVIAAAGLLLAAGAVAAEPLKPVKSMFGLRGGSNDGRWFVTGERGALGFWDLRLGRQVAAVEFPVEPNVGDASKGQDMILQTYSLSPDGRLILAAAYRHFFDASSGEWKTWSSSKLYLLSTTDGKILATIAELRKMPCNSNYGIQGLCPRVYSASFSPDGKKILVESFVEADWSKTAATKPQMYEGKIVSWTDVVHKSRYELLVVDLTGKVIGRQSYSAVRDDSQKNAEWVYSPAQPQSGFLPDDRAALLYADAAGCRIKDFSGAQVSFLADCAPGRKPELSRGKAWSSTGGFTVWDPLTGAVLVQSPATPKEPFAVSMDLTGWVESAYQEKASTASVKVVDAASGKTVLERTLSVTPDWQPNYNQFVRGEDRLMTNSYDDKYNPTYAIYALGAAPAAPVAAPVAAAEPAAGPDIETPPLTKTKLDPDAYAVVIGVEKYRQEGIPAVDYAERDAQAIQSYLTHSMGYDAKNVMLLTNERATKTDLEKYLGKWLANRVTAKSRVFVYYAGHGSPNPTTGDAYLMPYEADPAYLEETAVPLSRVYASLEKLPTKNVSVVLDACFSGQGGRSLVAKGTRPLVATKETKPAGNSVVLAAAGAGQISASDPARRHGLLTAALLEALQGAADADGDGVVTAAEAYEYVRPAVERAARLQNVDQTPTFSEKKGTPRAWIRLK